MTTCDMRGSMSRKGNRRDNAPSSVPTTALRISMKWQHQDGRWFADENTGQFKTKLPGSGVLF